MNTIDAMKQILSIATKRSDAEIWNIANVAINRAQQAFGDLTGVKVCCGEYATCCRPCTPRGRWEMQQAVVPQEAPIGSVYANSNGTFELLDYKGYDHPVGTYLDVFAAPQSPQGEPK